MVDIIYYYMVVIKLKFLCGDGDLPMHYCKVCGIPHLYIDEAKKCELGHVNHTHNGEEAPILLKSASH